MLKKRIHGGIASGLVAFIFCTFICQVILYIISYLFDFEKIMPSYLFNSMHQIAFLLTALLFSAIFKPAQGRTFEFKKPHLFEFGGSYLIFLSGAFLTSSIIKTVNYFLPELREPFDKAMSPYHSEPFIIQLIISALVPAICEEFLFRGFILSSFSKVKKVWVKVCVVGLMFAVFHLIPYQILYVAPLGIAFTYIMVKTKNLLLPIIFHFLNNAESTIHSFYNSSLAAESTTYIPVYIFLIDIAFYSIIAVFLFYAGHKVLNTKNQSCEPNNDLASECTET